MVKTQKTFIDGIDLLANDTQISDGGYYYLINARQRLGAIEPNKKHLLIDNAPSGKKQGIIAIGNVNVIFVAGSAYYQIDGTSTWTPIGSFAMHTSVEEYFSIAAPASTMNFHRTSTGNASAPIQKKTDFTIAGTPAGIIVQDGFNQPWIIVYDEGTQTFTARVTQNYSQWLNNTTNREYVPIGRQMMMLNQKLYIVSPDGKSMYQSISGRPIDFMINVDPNGNKLPTEAQGGAASVSFSFDSDVITNITPVNVPDSFIYGTERNTRIITMDYVNTIFGEPTYREAVPSFKVGIVNQYSVIDILGDYALIDFEGVKSFNAVRQLQIEGRNSIFSLQLSRILRGIKQTNPLCFMFNNDAIFSIRTAWGRICAVYDTLLQKWVSFDITTCINIKQVSFIETTTETKLYAITDQDELFQMYADEENREIAQLHTKAFSSDVSQSNMQKSEMLKCFFVDGSTDTDVRVIEFVDGQLSDDVTQELKQHLAGAFFPPNIRPPIIPSNVQRNEPLTFSFKEGLEGTKIAYVIVWGSDAKLESFELQTRDSDPATAKLQKDRIYGTNS